MKKFLLTEIAISAIYTACMPQLWSGGISGYILYVIAILIIPIFLGYMFALFFLLISYIISLFFKTKLPKIHKIAFIGFLIVFIGLESQNVYKVYFQKDRQDAQNNIETTIKKDNVSVSENTVSKTSTEDNIQQDYDIYTEKKQMQKYMKGLLEKIGKNMGQDLISRNEKVTIPDILIDKTYLLYSKPKLSAAISKQDRDIKQYKEDMKNIFNKLTDDNAEFALLECTKRYREDLCKDTMKHFKIALIKIQKTSFEPVYLYISYMEEELKELRFIDDHYDKFRITERGPYFTDSELQAKHLVNMKEIENKFRTFNNKVQEISKIYSN